jgi:hypothetical protein
MVAEKNFRALNSPWLLKDIYAGKQFVDGEMVMTTNRSEKEAA